MELSVGLSKEVEVVVDKKHAAGHMKSGDVSVLSTPSMILFMERAAALAVKPLLPAGSTTVGTRVTVSHLAPAPVGAKVVAKARLVGVDGRKLVFEVSVFWRGKKLGEGTHERFIVDEQKFIDKLKKKLG